MNYTAQGLVDYAYSWLNFKTRYGWGCWGQPITAAIISQKAAQYPANYSSSRQALLKSLIGQAHVIDCVGLIKGYYWGQEPGGNSVGYNSISDVSANGMYDRAVIKGPIATMPDTPGLCVQMDGHIGVYIGQGYVVESTLGSFGDGVIKTRLKDRTWVHWLQCPYISYDEEVGKMVEKKIIINGQEVTGYEINDKLYGPIRESLSLITEAIVQKGKLEIDATQYDTGVVIIK